MGEAESWSARRPAATLRFLPDAAAPGPLTRALLLRRSPWLLEQPVESQALEVGVGPPGVFGGGSGGGSVSARPFRLFCVAKRATAPSLLAVIRWPCAPRRLATVAHRDPRALRVRVLPRACLSPATTRDRGQRSTSARKAASSPSCRRPVKRESLSPCTPGQIGNQEGRRCARGSKRRWASGEAAGAGGNPHRTKALRMRMWTGKNDRTEGSGGR